MKILAKDYNMDLSDSSLLITNISRLFSNRKFGTNRYPLKSFDDYKKGDEKKARDFKKKKKSSRQIT